MNRSSATLHGRADCEPADPANTVTDRLNTLLNSSGPGYTLPLCPGAQYLIQAPILFAAQDQEISTVGYPTDDDRATLVVSGPVANGQGHTTAVDGTCATCSGVKLRHAQARPFYHCLPSRPPPRQAPHMSPTNQCSSALRQLQLNFGICLVAPHFDISA